MGNTPNKAAEGSEESKVEEEDADLLAAVKDLPKVVTLKSVKKPKGPKGRKPPSRSFLQNILSYFQVKPPTTVNVKQEVNEPPTIVLDLNVIEKPAVLENVNKGRPPPPTNRRRPARVRNIQPRQKDITNTSEVEKSNDDENIKKETKIFLKPPNRSQSKWKSIGIKTVPATDKSQEVNENEVIEPEENNSLKENYKADKPEENNDLKGNEDLHLSQPPGKPPRPSLEKTERDKALTVAEERGPNTNSDEDTKDEEIETPLPKTYLQNAMRPNMLEELNLKIHRNVSAENQSPVPGQNKPNLPVLGKPKKAVTSEDQREKLEEETPNKIEVTKKNKPKPELPKLDKPKMTPTDGSGQNVDQLEIEASDESTKSKTKTDFLKDLNKRLQIKPQLVLIQPKAYNDEVCELSDIEEDNKTPQNMIPITPIKIDEDVSFTDNKEVVDEKIREESQIKKAKEVSKIEKVKEESQIKNDKEKIKGKGLFNKMKKLNIQAAKKINRSFSKSFDKSPLPTEDDHQIVNGEPQGKEERNTDSTTIQQYNTITEADTKDEEVCEIETPPPKTYLQNVMRPNMLEELNVKIHSKNSTETQSPVPEKSQNRKPVLPQSAKPNRNSGFFNSQNQVQIYVEPEPSSPVVLKAIKRTSKDKRASGKTFNAQTLANLDEEACDIDNPDFIIDKKIDIENLDAENKTSRRNTDTNNNHRNKPIEEPMRNKKKDQIDTRKLSVPTNIRKKSCQSIALEDAFNILDFELDTGEEKQVTDQNYVERNAIRHKKIPRSDRKKSVQSVALENAVNNLDFELEPLTAIKDDEKESLNLNKMPILRSGIVDLTTRMKSVQSIALENSFSVLESQLDDEFDSVEVEVKGGQVVNRRISSHLDGNLNVRTTNLEERDFNDKQVLSSEQNKTEEKSVVGEIKDIENKKQNEEKSSLSFDLRIEPSKTKEDKSDAQELTVSHNIEKEKEKSDLFFYLDFETSIVESNEKEIKDDRELSLVVESKENKSVVGENKENGTNKQHGDKSSLSFDLGTEPSIDESNVKDVKEDKSVVAENSGTKTQNNDKSSFCFDLGMEPSIEE
eukprot:GFUD01082150.1.p1 GENE.GFUD01082150.1~~GFUD01082150.1.p1  ORF type:complete len:1073 (+),score=353.55 GFUD01082150.1:126-3344(+)